MEDPVKGGFDEHVIKEDPQPEKLEPSPDENATDGPIKATRPDGTPIPGDENPAPEIRRGPPKGWKCSRNGHIADEDFPPGGPVVQTTAGKFYGFPTGRCIACECVFTLKQEVQPPSNLVKADGNPQQAEPGGLIKP